MANTLNPSAEGQGNKLIITYDTEEGDNVKPEDVTMNVTQEGNGIRIEFKAKAFTHTSGFLPDSVVGKLQETPKSITYASGAIKVIYVSNKPIGTVTTCF